MRTDDDPRMCQVCGRRWRARDDGAYTALGLRLRRAARHAGVEAAWAHPRPFSRCPSCASRSVGVAPPDPPAAHALKPVDPSFRAP